MLTKIVDESVAKSDTKARETIAAEAQLQEHIKVEIQPPTPTLLIVKTQTNPTLAKIDNTGLPTVEGWGGTPSPCPGGARAKITGLSTVVGWGGATQPPSPIQGLPAWVTSVLPWGGRPPLEQFVLPWNSLPSPMSSPSGNKITDLPP